jgi:hypothetical protein
MAEPHLPQRDRLSEFVLEVPPLRDPLSEFAPEGPGPGEWNRLPERALPIGVAAAPDVSLATGRASRGRWLSGSVMLGVGLVAGFAGGVGVVTQYGGDQNVLVRSLALNRVDSELPRVQPPPNPPVADRPTDDPDYPIAQTTNDPPRTTEADAATAAPEPLITGQRASVKPVETIPGSPLAVLYVQSRPAGAEVYLDGQLITTTPFQLSDVTPGRHTIRIELQGYRSWSTPVSLEPGTRIEIAAALEP